MQKFRFPLAFLLPWFGEPLAEHCSNQAKPHRSLEAMQIAMANDCETDGAERRSGLTVLIIDTGWVKSPCNSQPPQSLPEVHRQTRMR